MIDDQINHATATASVGGAPRIDLRHVGRIAGMDLFIDLAGQDDRERAYKLAVAVLFKAFVGGKNNG